MNDDRNVIMLVSNPHLQAKTFKEPVETRQILPAILSVLGLNPQSLEAVQKEHTQVLPEVPATSDECPN
ncbi:MAG: hypothetical protein M3Y57_15415 [Acidobacteriota bacterium]|nr:hypothetical protein [Acidobacteriota bacterium]